MAKVDFPLDVAGSRPWLSGPIIMLIGTFVTIRLIMNHLGSSGEPQRLHWPENAIFSFLIRMI